MHYTYEYPRPAVTTDAIIIVKELDEYSILLIERANDPYQGTWALPGGFVEQNENLQDACKRELVEETCITADSLTQFKTYGDYGRDPRGHTISVVFYTILQSKPQTKHADDAADAKWFSINKLPPLAFDHQKIIHEFIEEIL